MSANPNQSNLLTDGTMHPSPEDLALYAMQLLSAGEMTAITDHLADCSQCRDGLARLHDDLAAYAVTAEPASPPAAARDRLLAQVAREEKVVSITRAQIEPQAPPAVAPFSRTEVSLESGLYRRKPQPRRPILLWSGWAMAAALAIAVVVLYQQHGQLSDILAERSDEVRRLNNAAASARQLLDALTDPQAMRVTLTPKAGSRSGPIGGVTYNPDRGTLVFLANNLDPVQTYKTYELWIIPADGATPIPAGTFHPDDRGGASVILPDIPKGIPAKAFGVTIEDAEGSTKPTPPIILSGS